MKAELKEEILKLEIDDLKVASQLIKARHNQLIEGAGAKLALGQKVKFKGKHGEELHGEVVKINRKTVKVDVDGITWWVTPTALYE